MLLFFYGQDGYRSFQTLQALKAKYVDASLGDTNLTTLDAAAVKPDDLAPQLLALPFLAKTRLVILPQLLSAAPKAVQERFEALIPKIPETTVAVVYEPGVPDRRTLVFKQLAKSATVQTFEPLMGPPRNRWIDSLLAPHGATIEPAAREALLGMTGDDSWRIATELTKLATSLLDQPAGTRTITAGLVADLVVGTAAINIFGLTDALLAGKPARAVGQLRSLTEQGENEQYLVAMVASALRSLTLVRSGLDQGHATQAALAAATGLKPFVVGKQLATAKRVTIARLAGLYQALLRLDAGLKDGTMQSGTSLELAVIRTAEALA